jgi:hypothetical protein
VDALELPVERKAKLDRLLCGRAGRHCQDGNQQDGNQGANNGRGKGSDREHAKLRF